MKKILFLLGPNLNMVGIREKGVYGTETAETIEREITEFAKENGFEAEVYQSNHEGDLIDKIHQSRLEFDGAVINAGALTHYSYALRDAIASVSIPYVEVHMSKRIEKLKSKWDHMSLPAKASLAFLVCSFFQRGISTITTPIFTNRL